MTNELLNAALAYILRGWKIIPLHTPLEDAEGYKCSCGNPKCGSIGKHPRTMNGLTDASKDREKIEGWWHTWPDANIGLVTGSASGVVVLDIDGPDGEESIKGKQIPPAPQQRTGMGTHILFRHPGTQIKNFSRKLPGVDLRGDGGYIVVAPSLHYTGNRYEWGIKPGDIDPPDMPEWLVALCQRPVQPVPAGGTSDKIQAGRRNDSLYRRGSWMRGKGWSAAAVLAALLEENKDKCDPPLDESEVRNIATSASKHPEGKPDSDFQIVTPAELFPLAITMGEFLTTDVPRREYLLEPWFLEKNIAMVYGFTGHGKTWITLGTAAAVAAGARFLRWRAPKPRKVLFVDGELPFEELQDKSRTLIASMRMPDEQSELLSVNMRIMNTDIFRKYNIDTPNIAEVKGQELIEKFIDGEEYIVLDNLSTLARGGVENEAESWQVIQDWIVSLRGRGINVLFAHHAGYSGTARGTTKRMDVLDYTLSVEEPPNKDPNDGARFIVTFHKKRGKHILPDAFTPFEAWMLQDREGPYWTDTDMAKQLKIRIIELYKEGVTKYNEIAEELGTSKPTISRILRQARKAGEI